MLILRRVKLVNWHFFSDALVELGETTLLAGDNGSGKSTIIDAIQYALVADIRRIQFNAAAAQNRTSRNLESYCRCKIGATDLDFYHQQDIITHVILEFRNMSNSFLAGIMVEAYTNSEIRESLWILEQGKIEDIEVYEGDVLIQPRSFREKVKYLGAFVCSTKKEYSSRLTHLLKVHRRNMDFNPYFEALVRSVSFTPFTSIDRFVCNYILDERQVDISAMKENLFNYKEAEREAISIEEKIRHLEIVKNLQKEADDAARAIMRQEYLKRRLHLEITVCRQEENKKETGDKERELANLKESLNYTEEQTRSNENLFLELTVALAGNNAHILYEQLNNRKKELTYKLKTEQERIARYNLYKEQCEALIGRKLAAVMRDEIENIDREKNESINRRLVCEQKKKEVWQILSDLKKEEQELEKGMLRYPESTRELQRVFGENGIDAWVFADRIEVTDPDWQNAVEGWLNNQRFNILVQEKDFQKAVEIYNRLPRRTAGVGIPDLARMHDAEIAAGSLAEVVTADSPLSRCYAAFLMGSIMMTTIEHLRDYEKAVTRECMKYSSRTATRMKEEVYTRWYIGRTARERRLATVRELLQKHEQELEKLIRDIKGAAEKEDLLQRAYRTLYDLRNLEDAFDKEKRLITEIAEVEAQIAAIDTAQFEELKIRIETVRLRQEELRMETARLNTECGIHGEALKSLRHSAAQLAGEHREYEEELHNFLKAHAQSLNEFEEYYEERAKRDRTLGGLQQLLGNYNQSLKGLETRLNDKQTLLRARKHEYNLKYHTYMHEEGDDSAQFLATLNKYGIRNCPYTGKKSHMHARKLNSSSANILFPGSMNI